MIDRETASDIQALDGIRARLQAAENAGDTEAIVALLAGDAVIMVPSCDVQEGRAACEAFLRDILPAQLAWFDRRIAYVSAEVSVNGDLAFDRGSFSFTATPRSGGETTSATGKYLWLYSRGSDGAWTLARAIVSLDEEEDEQAPGARAGPLVR